MSSYSSKGKTPVKATSVGSVTTRSQAKPSEPSDSGDEAKETVDLPALEKQVDDLEERYDDLPSREEFNTLRQLVLALQGTIDFLSKKVSEL